MLKSYDRNQILLQKFIHLALAEANAKHQVCSGEIFITQENEKGILKSSNS